MSARSLAPRSSAAPRGAAHVSAPDPARLGLLPAIHRQFGNRATGLLLQTKLRVGRPDDRYEQEADNVADLVMRTTHHSDEEVHPVEGGPVIQPCSCGGSCASCSGRKHEEEDLFAQRQEISPAPLALVQRESTESCEVKDEAAESPEPEEVKEDDEETKATEEEEFTPGTSQGAADAEGTDDWKPDTPAVQPKRRASGLPTHENVEARIESTRGNGALLPSDTRRLMESRFGHDFSSVRVHTDQQSHGLNRDLNSLAFTTGSDIYFAPGQFQPGSDGGKRLLAHELTHVVQQAGGSGGVVREKADPSLVSRASKPETKFYYMHRVSGTSVHHIIENILRQADTQLVTEAAIPGANRFSPQLNKIGVADLYKSVPDHTVTGVKGFRDVDKEADVVAMNNPTAVGTRPAVNSSPLRTGVGKNRGWSGDFPSQVSLGEIKPLSSSKVGAGFFQLDAYDQGYKAFVARIHQLSGSTRATISVGRLTLSIPPRLDFDRWDSQHATPSNDTTFSSRRLWIANLGHGLYVYFDLASSLRGGQPPGFAELVRRMREVRANLGREKQRTDKLEPMASGKFLPGPRNIAPIEEQGRGVRVVQRVKDRPANYWSERGAEWEKQRSAFGKDARTALKNQYREYRDKLRIEKKLGRAGRSAPATEKSEVKEYSQLMFWSGLPGRFLGKVRFLLGSVWDKIIGVFEKFKEKLHGLRTKVSGTSEEGMASIGWQKTLLKILVKAAKAVAIKFITESFNFFVDCFHSAMDKVLEKLQAELTEKFAHELCEARKFFDKSKEELDKQWGVSFTQIMELVTAIQDAKRWIDIANGLITLIRIGVEAISCLTPPALGCLWGLVAQIGIGVGLDLLIGTRWFDDNIVTPTVRDLVRTYATPYYQKLINRALGENLKEYHCHIADDAFPKLAYTGPSDGLTGAELIAHRDAWQAVNQDKMLQDLQRVFKSPKGKKPTLDELQKLADLIKKSGKTPEEIKAMLLAQRDPASGKLDLQQATTSVELGQVPQVPEGAGETKKRKIDYPKATRANLAYQQQLHWDPITFYAKPGVAVDSEEFADAVYDLQESLHIHADGILGDLTLTAFYDRNKLKQDAAYAAATRVQEQRKEAKEKAEKAKRDKQKAEAGKQEEAGEPSLVAIQVAKPSSPARATYWLGTEPGLTGIPFGTVTPEITGSETPGMMLTVNIRFYTKYGWVWLNGIPATFVESSKFNGRPQLTYNTADEFYFKLTETDPDVFVEEKGNKGLELTDYRHF